MAGESVVAGEPLGIRAEARAGCELGWRRRLRRAGKRGKRERYAEREAPRSRSCPPGCTHSDSSKPAP